MFGMRLFFTSASGYVALIILASLLGILPYALAAAITASIFRIFSGGAHASSPLRCNLIGVSVFLVIGLVTEKCSFAGSIAGNITIIITLFGMYIVYTYVPTETPGKPISSQIQRKYLRIISFFMLAIWCIASLWELNYTTGIYEKKIVLSSCLGMSWQLFTLLPLSYRVVGKMDTLLKHFIERLGIFTE